MQVTALQFFGGILSGVLAFSGQDIGKAHDFARTEQTKQSDHVRAREDSLIEKTWNECQHGDCAMFQELIQRIYPLPADHPATVKENLTPEKPE